MEVTLTLWVLAGSGVASVLLFAAKGLLDQLPGVFDSWHAARRAWRGGPARTTDPEPRQSVGVSDRPGPIPVSAPDSRV